RLLDPLHRWRHQRVVDHLGRCIFRFDDVTVGRDTDARRWQRHEIAADRPRDHAGSDTGRDRTAPVVTAAIVIAVVDDDDLLTALVTADSPQHAAVAIVDGDDLRAVRPHDHGAGVVADPLLPDVARAITEAVFLVVPDERL